MGVDMTMHIINSKGEFVAEDIYSGRNSEWFALMQGNKWDTIYESLPIHYNLPDRVPEKVRQHYLNRMELGYYHFRYMKVEEFFDWFSKKRPDIDAGWVTTYAKWLYENKGILPDEVFYTLPEDARVEDFHFIEIHNSYDNSKWLYYYLATENKAVSNDDYIVYYFDC